MIESKETEFDIEVGIPQTLTDMLANSMPNKHLFGMVSNGNSFIFLKVTQGKETQYDFSETYTLLFHELISFVTCCESLKELSKL